MGKQRHQGTSCPIANTGRAKTWAQLPCLSIQVSSCLSWVPGPAETASFLPAKLHPGLAQTTEESVIEAQILGFHSQDCTDPKLDFHEALAKPGPNSHGATLGWSEGESYPLLEQKYTPLPSDVTWLDLVFNKNSLKQRQVVRTYLLGTSI